MAEIKGNRAFIFGKDASDLVEVIVEIVCRQLREEAAEAAAAQAGCDASLSDERCDR